MPARCFAVPLRWSDMDAYGHVNNVQFVRLLEEARVALFDVPVPGAEQSMLAAGVLVSRLEIEYLAPLVYRAEPIVVRMWVTRLSGAGFDLGYEVLDRVSLGVAGQGSPAVYARAETGMVLYDLAEGRPRRMSAQERRRLDELMDEPVSFRRRPLASAAAPATG